MDFPYDDKLIQLFAQAACTQDQATLQSKNSWGLAVACIGLGMVLGFRAFISNLRDTELINDKLIDLKLITANDYTIATSLPDELYTKFCESEKLTNCACDESPIHKLEDYMSEKIEEELQRRGLSKQLSCVADIQFGFNNAKML